MPTITWSLVTVTFNSAETLRQFWTGARPASVEWIVVDNCSTDNSAEVAKELGAHVIQLDKNIGFSAANNRGLEIAAGEFIAFVNPDVNGNWSDLDRLAKTASDHQALVSPQLLNANSSFQPNGRGAPLLLHKVLNRLSPNNRDNGYQITAEQLEHKFVFWLMGATIAGSASLIRKLGGWNERYFLYYEDKDLSLRAWSAGVPVILDGRVRWSHGWARETSSFRLTPWLREFDSLLRFYTKYPEFLGGSKRIIRRKHPEPSMQSGLTCKCDR